MAASGGLLHSSLLDVTVLSGPFFRVHSFFVYFQYVMWRVRFSRASAMLFVMSYQLDMFDSHPWTKSGWIPICSCYVVGSRWFVSAGPLVDGVRIAVHSDPRCVHKQFWNEEKTNA